MDLNEMAMGWEEALCRVWLPGSWGSVSNIHGWTHPWMQPCYSGLFSKWKNVYNPQQFIPGPLFCHFHLRYHITLWCTLTLGSPTDSVWSWHPCWVTLEKRLWKTPARGRSINRHVPKQAPTLTVQLTGLLGSLHNYREGQKNLIWIRGVFGGQPLK